MPDPTTAEIFYCAGGLSLIHAGIVGAIGLVRWRWDDGRIAAIGGHASAGVVLLGITAVLS